MQVIDLVLNDWFNMLILRIILFGIQIFIVKVFKAHMYWVCISGKVSAAIQQELPTVIEKMKLYLQNPSTPNNSFQANKVSYGAEFVISMFIL